jgi:hypothetical protein
MRSDLRELMVLTGSQFDSHMAISISTFQTQNLLPSMGHQNVFSHANTLSLHILTGAPIIFSFRCDSASSLPPEKKF